MKDNFKEDQAIGACSIKNDRVKSDRVRERQTEWRATAWELEWRWLTGSLLEEGARERPNGRFV